MVCEFLSLDKNIIKKWCSIPGFTDLRHVHDVKFLCNLLNPGLIPKENDLACWSKCEPAHNGISLYDADMADKWFGDGKYSQHD